jgi:uncharacterized protein (DUF2252 family)
MPKAARAPKLAPASPLGSVGERRAAGQRLRDAVPRKDHAKWAPPASRPDPVEVLIETSRTRIPELLPIRYGRMVPSPLGFLRGSAAVMATDLAHTPATGIRVQACGDCHLLNFGAFATPEGNAVFDINDFDETLPAPFEWDVKRLAASVAVAGRNAKLTHADCAAAARGAVCAYRERMTKLASQDPFAVWHARIDLAEEIAAVADPKVRNRARHWLDTAGAHAPPLQDFPKLLRADHGTPRIRDNPPLIYHFDPSHDDAHSLDARAAFRRYERTLPEERRILYDRYRLADIAFKVVGVGSVGTFCAIGLFVTADAEPLFLQIKEAQPSVLAPYAGASAYPNQGQRVVTGQRIMQAASDIFLGWTQDAPRARDFYVRQLKDRKLASIGSLIENEAFLFYAALCGRTLARAHARSGDAAMIAGYLGTDTAFDAAVAKFAMRYADQTDRDHDALVAAARTGRVHALTP